MSITLSQDFLHNVRVLYSLGLEGLVSGKGFRQGINGYSIHAAPAFVSSVAAIEAFTNEIFISPLAKTVFEDTPLQTLESEWVEKLELTTKLVLLPQLLFGQTFRRDGQPFQDMNLVIKIRNDLVHYKMKDNLPKYLPSLVQRGIALKDPPEGHFLWVHQLNTTEGIRWAHNTVCCIAHALVELIPKKREMEFIAEGMAKDLLKNFKEIPKTIAEKFLRDHNIVI